MGLLDGRVAIVTGAGGGLGRAHALAMAREGAAVVVNDAGGDRRGEGHSSSRAEVVVAEIIGAGGRAVAHTDSIATVDGGEGVVATAIDAFGKADILVNNAGILRDRTIGNLAEADWDAVIAVHLKGAYCTCRPMFSHLRERGDGGVIVNTSSTSGLLGNFGQTNYGAAKAGVAGLTRCLALEGARFGIRVWGLVPWAHTRMSADLPGMDATGVAQRLDPSRVSPVVLYMVSDLSANQTGKFLFAGRGRVAELAITASSGIDLGGELTPQAIAENAANVFLPDQTFDLLDT